jgi:hypothetical protein
MSTTATAASVTVPLLGYLQQNLQITQQDLETYLENTFSVRATQLLFLQAARFTRN